MKKIFLSLVAVVSAVTMMAQELPTACDAQIEFKYCFTTYGTDAQDVYTFALPMTWNGVTFPVDGTYPMQADGTITNARGCDSIVTMTVTVKEPPVGAAGGKKAKLFTVGEGKQIFFSQGNLQFRPTADGTGTDLTRTCTDETTQYGIFRFAENQYDYVTAVGGNANNYMPGNVYYDDGGTQKKCVNDQTNNTYKGWMDLFAWGASGYKNVYPYTYNANDYYYGGALVSIADLAGTNFDWGVYNPITNGGNTAGQWRTLSSAEWDYLIFARPGATSKVAKATIKDGSTTVATGIIILPDEWDATQVSVTVKTGSNGTTGNSPYRTLKLNYTQTDWAYNTFTLADWAVLDQAGVVFLPAVGWHFTMGSTSYTSPEGHYYTSTSSHTYNSRRCGDVFDFLSPMNNAIRVYGSYSNYGSIRMSVRLVADK